MGILWRWQAAVSVHCLPYLHVDGSSAADESTYGNSQNPWHKFRDKGHFRAMVPSSKINGSTEVADIFKGITNRYSKTRQTGIARPSYRG